MTDAGHILPTQDGASSAERKRLLRQIASALELPVSAITDKVDPGEGYPSSEECSAALAAFSKIADRQLRAICLELLESCAKR